jgi:FAD/FMN-containing dehydrogenase
VVTENVYRRSDYETARQQLEADLKSASVGALRLKKETSNLFRERNPAAHRSLDLRAFNHVLSIDPEGKTIDVEGMTTYVDLVRASLQKGVMPMVVPQLKSITVGGAVSGIGIESSSFRYGLPHESVLEMDVLLPSGDIITCTPDNQHRDLFFAIPNSYGTLGYILRLVIQAIPTKPYVQLTHVQINDSASFFSALTQWCDSDVDFIDGCILQRDQQYLTLGRFSDEAPYTSDYSYLDIYYRSVPNRSEDYLRVSDYLWRWDTDWFWCSKNLFLENKTMRRLLGRERLSSVTYQKVMRWNTRIGLTRNINRLMRVHTESVIQDVDIPVDKAREFVEFLHREIGILPIWVCPVRHRKADHLFPLFPMTNGTLYVNFGFWDVVRTRNPRARGYFNRKVEAKVTELGGIKSLYSDAFYSHRAFWQAYDGQHYRALKQRYDPEGLFKDLYEKCVLRQ